MSAFVVIDHIDQVFPLANGGAYIALKNISLEIKKGEFVTLLGHSGCGKSTLLNIIAGLARPTAGGILLEGRQVTEPGPDRMVVFQNYSLLPWLTVRQNIALAVDEVMSHLPASERSEIVEHHIDMVKLRPAAEKRPGQLSGGMKQRVSIARALSIKPKVLLLDEPFGALDALTRSGLQDQLMQIAQQNQLTCIMVTHDVDEALLLSDRIVMLTNGPESYIGQIIDVPFARPRERLKVVNHPNYYALRSEISYFLNQQKKAKQRKTQVVAIARNGLEKVNLELGFMPLTDCASLVVAHEMGMFKKYGLEEVTLSREPSWKAISEGVVSKRLDAAQMVAGMPLGLTVGMGGRAPIPVVTSLVLSRNGNAITFSKRLFEAGVRNLADFKAMLTAEAGAQPRTLASVHPASMHNLIMRYWLASGGIDPDHDVNLTVIPPPQMVATLKAGNIDGFCVGEPWNAHAVSEGLGFVIANDLELWAGHPEKVLGMREDWANQYPETHLALVKALMEAAEYCDDRRNRGEIAELLAKPNYVGAKLDYIRAGFLDPYDRGDGRPPETLLRFNQFHIDMTNCPNRGEALWILTQLARWGIAPFPKNWVDVLDRVRRMDVYGAAARALEMPDTAPNRGSFALFDGTVFNPDDPLGYLDSLAIKQEIQIQEIDLDGAVSKTAVAA